MPDNGAYDPDRHLTDEPAETLLQRLARERREADPICPVCDERYINRGAHAERCTGPPVPPLQISHTEPLLDF